MQYRIDQNKKVLKNMCLMPQVFSLDSRHMLYSRGPTNRYSSGTLQLNMI